MIYLNSNYKTLISKRTNDEISKWYTVLKTNNGNIELNNIILKYKQYIYDHFNINKNKYDILLTSGSSKSNNFILKLLSSIHSTKKKQIHIIISSIDDIFVINYCKLLEKNKLISLSLVNPNNDGIIELCDIKKLVNTKTFLINIPYSNGELGSINNIKEINEFCKSVNILYFCNFDHLFGLSSINLNIYNIDFISLSFDNFYGPNDIGLLLIKKNLSIELEKIEYNIGSSYYLLNPLKNIPLILGSLSSLIDVLKKRKERNLNIYNFKLELINKLDQILPIISYNDYINTYNQSIIKLSIILFGSKLLSNNSKNTICLSIFSIKTCINIIEIKKYLEKNDIIISSISNNVLNNLNFDTRIRRGLISISFDDTIKKNNINYIFKKLVSAISQQYVDIYKEIKDNIIVKGKLNSKREKKVVRFSTPLCRFLPDIKKNKIYKSILSK